MNAICNPSGEKIGFEFRSCPVTRRRASPPSRDTTQISPAYANVMAVFESDGFWRRRGAEGEGSALDDVR